MSGSPTRDTNLTEMARVSPVVSLDPPHRHFRSARHASVSAGTVASLWRCKFAAG
jgi:hypothetical protein